MSFRISLETINIFALLNERTAKRLRKRFNETFVSSVTMLSLDISISSLFSARSEEAQNQFQLQIALTRSVYFESIAASGDGRRWNCVFCNFSDEAVLPWRRHLRISEVSQAKSRITIYDDQCSINKLRLEIPQFVKISTRPDDASHGSATNKRKSRTCTSSIPIFCDFKQF